MSQLFVPKQQGMLLHCQILATDSEIFFFEKKPLEKRSKTWTPFAFNENDSLIFQIKIDPGGTPEQCKIASWGPRSL